MTPPKPKPPAVPVEMPRTERDLDLIMSAVEAHKTESNRLGELNLQGKISLEDLLEQASMADARLYDVLDAIAIERDEEFTDADEQLRESRRGAH